MSILVDVVQRVAVFGTAGKFFDVELNQHAVPFISEGHAKSENYGIHSPGPILHVNKPPCKVANLKLGEYGPKDRFYSRFEQGRMT